MLKLQHVTWSRPLDCYFRTLHCWWHSPRKIQRTASHGPAQQDSIMVNPIPAFHLAREHRFASEGTEAVDQTYSDEKAKEFLSESYAGN